MVVIDKKKIRYMYVFVIILVLFTSISIAVNIKFIWYRSKGYDSVRCIDCYEKTNYLTNTGQTVYLSEETYLDGQTIEELIPQIEHAFPWMCDNCVYKNAQYLLYGDVNK